MHDTRTHPGVSGAAFSWVRNRRPPSDEKPRGLVGLLIGLGVLAGVTGFAVGAALNQRSLPYLHATLVALAWAAPFFVFGDAAWRGATPRTYGIIQSLGISGTILSGFIVFLLPRMNFTEGTPPSVPLADAARYYAIFVPLLAANIALIVLGRSEEERIHGEVAYGYWSYKWTVGILSAYYMLTATI